MRIVIEVNVNDMPLRWHVKWFFRDIAFGAWFAWTKASYRIACKRIMFEHNVRMAVLDWKHERRMKRWN